MASTTFRVNLIEPDLLAHTMPVAPSDSASNFRETRSTWFPNLINNTRALKHNDEFTVTESSLIKYLKDSYTTGDNPLLEVV